MKTHLSTTAALCICWSISAPHSALAFDGANIWVANSSSNNVTELVGSSGAAAGTFAVGTSPAGIAFDGANLWVSNSGSNTVSKL